MKDLIVKQNDYHFNGYTFLLLLKSVSYFSTIYFGRIHYKKNIVEFWLIIKIKYCFESGTIFDFIAKPDFRKNLTRGGS